MNSHNQPFACHSDGKTRPAVRKSLSERGIEPGPHSVGDVDLVVLWRKVNRSNSCHTRSDGRPPRETAQAAHLQHATAAATLV